MDKYLLEIKDLETSIKIGDSWFPTINQISLKLKSNEILGIVGESGCGKSILNKSVIRLLPDKIAKVTNGNILFNGKNVIDMKEKEYQKIRGKDIGMIFQEPMTALNPVFKIQNQLIEPIMLHLNKSKTEAKQLATKLLEYVGISRVNEILNSYPHQLSGGMRQRVMIAMAISCNPKLLIADEPTTAIDVTIQAQILDLLKKLQQENDMAIILVTHDLSVVSEFCDKVMVMYAGQIVEYGDIDQILNHPQHPYTKKLLSTIPKLDEDVEYLEVIEGMVPNITEFKENSCRFANRCTEKIAICEQCEPALLNKGKSQIRCHLFN
ncbi:ABC transporter ATP-binding protein [Staphylococcus devriesei]|uniref:ABC transporter ATP-binding protein n=1 Tax=Staphylococcus devriesei TaxID=586733 RepID=A0A2K4DNT9_9STAP|nr:ABC transporter ATP-binding protein [Staphylococcus devriesei]MCE5096446.1 ABC transporter ATP-binding protein [Staphylococcus devriesei]PNZ88475.1 peptide ABC transporter ATP-binding protein [Staphylococcus devriesei]PTE71067.1 ABC transporter ATP-binding protein [Staphylococcus devriesei]PTF13012.1 ABC transporter ATP-binding protein [Staphylococcus devriesei]RIL73406.1 ABC transporter ATP-binding protein [Staphylococcus devriesei]